jgi:glutamyl-tRNA synthetase
VKDLEELGFIPEGVLNWIVLMGWGVAEGDVLSLQDMIEKFDLRHLTVSPAAISFAKLDHFNGTHIRLLSDGDLAARIKPFFVKAGLEVQNETLLKVAPLVKERITTLDEAVDMAGFFFRKVEAPAAEDLIGKGLSVEQSRDVIEESLSAVEKIEPFKAETVEPALREMVERMGLTAGQAFGILRMAVTGQKVSPPLFESMEVVGRETVVSRLRAAQTVLSKAR